MIEIIDGQEYKRCSKCGELKTVSAFNLARKGDGYKYGCKLCNAESQRKWREKNREKLRSQNARASERKQKWHYAKTGRTIPIARENFCPALSDINSLTNKIDRQREYYKSNMETIKLRASEYQKRNKEKINARNVAYRNRNIASAREREQKYRDDNRDRNNSWRRDYDKRLRSTNPEYVIRMSMAHRVNAAIKAKGGRKYYASMELVGCNPKELRQHLEYQFKPGMTWDNYGFYGWHIDHIRPCASFDLTDPEQQKQCFHYTNLQPLWAEENLRKGDKYEKTS